MPREPTAGTQRSVRSWRSSPRQTTHSCTLSFGKSRTHVFPVASQRRACRAGVRASIRTPRALNLCAKRHRLRFRREDPPGCRPDRAKASAYPSSFCTKPRGTLFRYARSTPTCIGRVARAHPAPIPARKRRGTFLHKPKVNGLLFDFAPQKDARHSERNASSDPTFVSPHAKPLTRCNRSNSRLARLTGARCWRARTTGTASSPGSRTPGATGA